MAAQLELYSKGICLFTEAVGTALNAAGVPHQFTRWAPADVPAWFAEASPDKTTPVMRLTDGTFTNQSVAMFRVADVLYPDERVAEWEAKLRGGLVPAFLKVLQAPSPEIQAVSHQGESMSGSAA
jgi:hypothetical protein